MTAAMYLRKSRAEENEPASETLSRHRDILTAFAKQQGITVADVYEEVVSGDSLYGRPQMLRLLENLRKYESVLCMDIDRLGRGAMHEQGLIFDAFRKTGTLMITPGKTYDMSDDMDDSLISFKALFAREEYKMIRGRLRRGTIKAVEEGCYLSNAPFGYKQVRVNKKPTLAIEPDEAEGVRLIFSLYREGKGCQIIADTLHALGYRPRRGVKFSRTTIGKILRSPVYIGKVVWNQHQCERPTHPDEKHRKRIKPYEEWLVTDGLHPAIIEPRIFEEANKRYRGRYHPPYNKGGTVMNPLAGVLFCKNCGRSMIRQPLQGKPYNQPILHCTTAGCMMSSSLEVTERMFYDGLAHMLSSLKATAPEEPLGEEGPDVAALAEAELSRMAGQLDKLHELLEQGVYDVDTFMRRRDELNGRIRQTQDAMKNRPAKPDAAETVERLVSVLEDYWSLDSGRRNLLIKTVIRRATYHKPKGSGWGAPPEIEIVELR